MLDIFQVLPEYKVKISVEDSTYFNPMSETIKYIKWLEDQVVENRKSVDSLKLMAKIAETDIDTLIKLVNEHTIEPEEG
jgi:hypothetical protein